jgi:predicted TIM-barrel fold metal-dependent hydrolase
MSAALDEDAVVIDVDGHVWEPDAAWEEHLDPAFLDRRPRIVRDERGTTRYSLDGRLMPTGTGRGAWAPEGFQEASLHRPGGVDPHARLTDMDTDGIDVAVLFGTLALGLWSVRDIDLQVACCRAFNDWLAAYCAADPARLRPAAALPLASIDDAVAEANRAVRELGAVTLTLHATIAGRNLDDPAVFPLYEAAERLDVAVGIHAGGTGLAVDRFVDQYALAHACAFPMDIMLGTTTLLGGGVLERFPRLRVALLEAGCGWFPSFLERLDEHHEKRPAEMPGVPRPPSEYVTEGRVVISCEPEEHGIAYAVERLGPGAVVFASDYPHWDAEFPGSVAAVRDRVDLDVATRQAILGGNARRLLGARLLATPLSAEGSRR